MPRRKEKASLNVVEQFKIGAEGIVKHFLLNDTSNELEFPSSVTAEQRAYVHELAKNLGLKSKSRGKGKDRFLTVYKRDGSTIVQLDAQFQLSMPSREVLLSFLTRFPLSGKERADLVPPIERDRLNMPDAREANKSVWRISTLPPQVPPPASIVSELQTFKQTLPIWNYRDKIVHVISDNSVTIIEGETGSGKTTQVPQFLLEHCRLQSKPCRIIVTEPRRIATITVAERVAYERDESVAGTVGYQIRLDNRTSQSTLLTFCTTGILLRTLMSSEANLANVTHILVDEVHERDKFCDFLLIALRDLLNKFRNLRIVLMSASIDTPAISKYFNNCPVVTIPGRQHHVTEYHLVDILKKLNYMTDKMKKVKLELSNVSDRKEQLEKWKESLDKINNIYVEKNVENDLTKTPLCLVNELKPEKVVLEPWLSAEMDKLLADAFLTPDNDYAINQVIYLIFSENISVDYQHSETLLTPLMVAAARNKLNSVEQLLNFGANLTIRSSNGWTAYDWALSLNNTEVSELIQSYASNQSFDETSNEIKTLSSEDQQLLNIYKSCYDDAVVDFELLVCLIAEIHRKQPRGAILIFLPGYDDILKLRDNILADEKKLMENTTCKFSLFILHSKMQTVDQKKVFKSVASNHRKIILSTNIAETSITIDDVVYVIDTGKVKEKSFDSTSGANSLRTDWISQACAKQRKGRAGRTQPGFCYRLYSSARYESLQVQSTPEILRAPLQELCLHSKLLAPSNTTIADFLSKAMDPPSFLVTRNAVQLLKTMDALDPWEDLTELGVNLLDLPVEPRLGKTLLYSVVLKCLDPVLTIVCCLTYEDLFHLPAQPYQKRILEACRKQLSAGSYSDHMTLLRVFQGWQQAKSSNNERAFCEKNFVSSATMEMVLGTRSQLLAQLRASGFVRGRPPGDIRDLNTNSENWAVIKAALCAGLYPNLARIDREHNVLRTRKECKVSFHPSSTLRDTMKNGKSLSQAMQERVSSLPSDWIMYEKLNRVGRFCHLHTCTLVSPITVALFSGPAKLPLENMTEIDMFRPDCNLPHQDSDSEAEEQVELPQSVLKLDDWVLFKVDAEAAQLALQLRLKWYAMFLRRMKSPSKPATAGDEAVVKAIVNVLTTEEQLLRLQQPSGIGQRPKPCYTQRDDDYQSVSAGSCSPLQDIPGNNSKKNNTDENKLGSAAVDTDKEKTKYFVIRAQNLKSIESSLSKGVWSFTVNVERKIIRAYKEGVNVVLVFSVQGTTYFHGYARLISGDKDLNTNQYSIQWLKRSNLPFQATKHLVNSLNEGRRVQNSRDGQEIEPSVGAALCALWDKANGGQFSNEENHGRPIRGFRGYDYNVTQRHELGSSY